MQLLIYVLIFCTCQPLIRTTRLPLPRSGGLACWLATRQQQGVLFARGVLTSCLQTQVAGKADYETDRHRETSREGDMQPPPTVVLVRSHLLMATDLWIQKKNRIPSTRPIPPSRPPTSSARSSRARPWRVRKSRLLSKGARGTGLPHSYSYSSL
jgi:hypothetical protein